MFIKIYGKKILFFINKKHHDFNENQVDSSITREDFVWAMGSFCALNKLPFDGKHLTAHILPPYNADSIIYGSRGLGLRAKKFMNSSTLLENTHFPCLAFVRSKVAHGSQTATQSGTWLGHETRPVILVAVSPEEVNLFPAGSVSPQKLARVEFDEIFDGTLFLFASKSQPPGTMDGAPFANRPFGFKWFIPEILKYKNVWRDILVASLVIQLLALGTPLFTQAVIDKVVVHRTESTLLVIGIGLAIFMIFTALLTWVRQYLVLHVGNRVDAVLGSAVFDHLFKLPTRYFENRQTGVIAARLHGVENIREFVASTAVTLALDLPFLLIFIGIMFYYSVPLTLLVLGIIGVVVALSLLMAPVFRTRLNRQFQYGARNQAFITEYISGLDTVKTLQMEPQLCAKYADHLADYLQAGFSMKQVANTYNVLANALEQLMSLLILMVGAYIVMQNPDFTIGMLVAFQMFASRVSQPMLRIVGLWQQFQQANMSVRRLGDIMDAPVEPYNIVPVRLGEGSGGILVENLSFRYSPAHPHLYEKFNMTIAAGSVTVVMGPSGSGKSTLTKLLLGFCSVLEGSIKIDGRDIRNLAANELRQHFGVVPQETVLFSGSIYENLLMANPHATFNEMVQACSMAEIHETIDALPNGYQTALGERGVGLSGGQKQRLSIARALLKHPKILIFDEATSSLDSETAEQFALTINKLRGKVTMLFITHAKPANLIVDKIVRIGARVAIDES